MYFDKKRERNSQLVRHDPLALWARARLGPAAQAEGGRLLAWAGDHAAGRIEYRINLRTRDVVVDIPAVTSVDHQPGLAQDHQLLRDVSLPRAEHGRHVAHTLLPVPQHLEDGQAGRVDQNFEQLTDVLVRFHFNYPK